jgi:hypothetical protein
MEISIVTHVSPALPPRIPGGDSGSAYQPLAAPRVTQPVADSQTERACAAEAMAMEDGGVAIWLDACDDLAPHWLAWEEWVDARQPCLAVTEPVDVDRARSC